MIIDKEHFGQIKSVKIETKPQLQKSIKTNSLRRKLPFYIAFRNKNTNFATITNRLILKAYDKV